MIYVNIIGGLGNQMFQYAFYEQLRFLYGRNNVKAFRNDFEHYFLREFELTKIFDLQIEFADRQEVHKFTHTSFLTKIARRLSSNKYISEKNYLGKVEINDLVSRYKNVFFYGYWQSESYFKEVGPVIQKHFSFPLYRLGRRNEEIREKILNHESVSIHVRRGDYLTSGVYEELGYVCNNGYYQNAIDWVNKKVDDPVFFVFSDDMEYCKNELNFRGNRNYFVDWNTNENSFWDMYLMSVCKNNIIPNSSFSWWSAWLNDHENKIVVTPKEWMRNDYTKGRIPDSWNRI